jgi:hypothetical protein
MLVAAIFDTDCECRRMELLYQHAQEQFSLISCKHGKVDGFEDLDKARARTWIARHRDQATIVVDV